MEMPMTQANVKQVTLTQDEADKRRVLIAQQKGTKARPVPQHVLDYLLPRVRIEQYFDEEGVSLGECWLWALTCSTEVPMGTPEHRERNQSIRRWVAQQMREKPIPAKWCTITRCAALLCVHPSCCLPVQKSRQLALSRERRGGLTQAQLEQRARAARSQSPLTPERVQEMRDEYAAAAAAGQPISMRKMGQRYGISDNAAAAILNGRRWSPTRARSTPPTSVFDLGRLA